MCGRGYDGYIKKETLQFYVPNKGWQAAPLNDMPEGLFEKLSGRTQRCFEQAMYRRQRKRRQVAPKPKIRSCEVKKVSPDMFRVTFVMTRGELLSLLHALTAYSANDALADVLRNLRKGILNLE